MESNKILGADILDIIFDGKNKDYGAYELRKTYNRRLFKAIAVTTAVILLVFLGGMVSGRGTKGKAIAPQVADLELTKVNDPTPPPVTPPPPRVEPVQVRTIAVTPPRIVHDDQVKPEDIPPTVDDIADARIGTVNQSGVSDGDIVAPPSPGGTGGVIEEPKKKEDEPEIWTKVEIESQFPGGTAAWQRFLQKNLHIPEVAEDAQGTVVIQFIVDENGNVSNVEAISGPEKGGLREEAVRVIRKSGQWTPAIQNGRKVKSYKRQPITIVISE